MAEPYRYGYKPARIESTGRTEDRTIDACLAVLWLAFILAWLAS